MDNDKKIAHEGGGWRRFIPLTDDPAKLAHTAELVKTVGKENIVFLLQSLKLNPDFEKPISNGTAILEKFLAQFMTDYTAEYLKQSLKADKQVHLVGFQGSGKTIICNLFANFGYKVTEPETTGIDEPFSMPNDTLDFTLIKVDPPVSYEFVDTTQITKADIENWLNS